MRTGRLVTLLGLALVVGASAVSAYEPKISLSGRKDRVVSIDERAIVLEVATGYLGKSEDAVVADLDGLNDPFVFGAAAEESESVITVTRTARVDYDDASLLEAVVPSFSAQVRGILTRSGGYYLQLAGGRLLTIGDTFPVRLPGLKEDAFNVTVSDINASGYVLSINEVERYVPLEDFGDDADRGRGVIRDMFE